MNSTNVDTAVTLQSQQFEAWDKTPLFYRHWSAGDAGNAIILVHGGHEHSGRFQELAAAFIDQGRDVFAWDARGHGESPGERGYADHFHVFVKDLNSFLAHIRQQHGIHFENMILVGHSVGSVIIATWLNDYGRRVKGVVLGSPAFHVKLYVPMALPSLRLWLKIKPDAHVNSYVKPAMLTHDEEEARQRRDDKLISPRIAVKVLTSLFDTAKRVLEHADNIDVPMLIFSATDDWVVHVKAQRRYFDRLSSSHKEFRELGGFYHEVFHEKDRHIPIEESRQFMDKLFRGNISPKTKAPLAKLPAAFAAWHPAHLSFALTRIAMKTVGRMSKGIRIGWRHGFDSGNMLDYVYENRAHGAWFIGKWMDRAYLDAVGWRDIRIRGANVTAALESTARDLLQQQQPVRIMDVASGPGRYIQDLLARMGGENVSALCRDWDTTGLEQGSQSARQRGIEHIEYARGDAFNVDDLASTNNHPNIVVVSGLYELFPDNEIIARSLSGIHSVMESGGYLIFTNQPYHPQLDFIAYTLINRDKQPWVMRLRSQKEMNLLVERAGFHLQSIEMDHDGIFTVSIARKS